jgi:hypothetical protein
VIDLLRGHQPLALPASPRHACRAQVGSVDEYLDSGPGFVFLAHPALGPLWRVIGQKLRGGSLAPRSELQLEAAEVCLRGVHVDGSLRVLADAPLGHLEMRPVVLADGSATTAALATHRSSILDSIMRSAEPAARNNGSATLTGLGSTARLVGGGGAPRGAPDDDGYSQPCTFPAVECDPGAAREPRLVFSDRCGRLRLHNVRVRNAGVQWGHPGNVWWRHSLERAESCRILLHGAAGEGPPPLRPMRSHPGPASMASSLCPLLRVRAVPHTHTHTHTPPPPEFEARDVTLSGDLVFEVPDGHRMLVLPGPDGQPLVRLEPTQGPTWRWRYSMDPAGEVQLEMEELSGGGGPLTAAGSSAGSTGGAAQAAGELLEQHHCN